VLPENTKVTHYKDLKIWQKGIALTKNIYRLTAKFPAAEVYGLSSQLRRAAVSIPSNIAEGQARTGTKEFLRSLSHASGSLAELETQILLGVELGYCALPEVESILQEIGELQKMVWAIRRKLSDVEPLVTRH
jgi:four helix bundle protein